MNARLLALALVFALPGAGRAEEAAQSIWTQFRGPDGQGHSAAHDLPVRFNESENVAWKVELPGTGWSSPVVLGDQIWMTTATELADVEGGKSLRAMCVDRATGRLVHNVEVVRVEVPENVNPKNSFASPTPVLEPGRAYVHFGTYGTACLDTATGNILWRRKDLKLDHKEGPGSSPILWRDLLIVNRDGMDIQTVVALDKGSGKTVWETPRPDLEYLKPDMRKAYCTPVVIDHQGQPQLISPGSDRVIAYDPATGKQLWWSEYKGFSNVPMPLIGHGRLYVCTGFTKPQLHALKPGGAGDVTAANAVWQCTKQVPKNTTPLVVGDQIYMFEDRGIATCIDAHTGEAIWTERLGGNFSASPILAEGKIWVGSEEGLVHVIQPGKSYESLAQNQLDGIIMATPAAVDSQLFIRTATHLYRIERVKAVAGP